MAAPTTVNEALLRTNFSSDDAFIEYVQNTRIGKTTSYEFTYQRDKVYHIVERNSTGITCLSAIVEIDKFATEIFQRELSLMRVSEANQYISNLNTLLGVRYKLKWYKNAAFTTDKVMESEDVGHRMSIRAALCVSRLFKIEQASLHSGEKKLEAFYQTFMFHHNQACKESLTWKTVGKTSTASSLIDSREEAEKHIFDDLALFERAYADFKFQQEHPRALDSLSRGLGSCLIYGKSYSRDHRQSFLEKVYHNLLPELKEAVKHHLWELISEKQGYLVPFEMVTEGAFAGDLNLYEQAIKMAITEQEKRKPNPDSGETKEAEPKIVKPKKAIKLAVKDACYLEIKKCISLFDRYGSELELAPEASTPKEITDWMKANRSKLAKACVLTIRNSEITFLPKDFLRFFPLLLDITITATKLSALHPDQFEKQVALETINLSNNQLMEMPKNIFNTLTKLHSVDLSSNRLESLPPEIFSKGNIHRLNLYNNQLYKSPTLAIALNTNGLRKCRAITVDAKLLDPLPDSNPFKRLPDLAEITYWGVTTITHKNHRRDFKRG